MADFIGESNIISATMVQDRLVKILGVNFPCVDEGFGQNRPVDVVIRPEDIDLLKPGQGSIDGVVTHMIFKGVHYEMEVMANNYECWCTAQICSRLEQKSAFMWIRLISRS